MTHFLRKSALLGALLSLLSVSLHAHGSLWSPPKDGDNPGTGYKGPGDTNRPLPGGNPGDRKAPTRPGAGNNGGSGGTGSVPATLNPPHPSSILASQELQMSSWSWWWEFNKEPFLELRRHLSLAPIVTGSDGFYLGRGEHRPSGAGEDARLDPALVRETVLPTLLEVLGEDASTDITSACLVALAKIGNDHGDDLRRDLALVLQAHLRDPNQEITETAAAALGILGRSQSAFLLADIAADAEPGRRAVGSRRVPVRTRAFAAYGLGLLGHRSDNEDVRRFVVHKLARILADDDTKSRDLSVACVLSLGRVPLAWETGGGLPEARRPLVAASRETQVAALLALVRDARADHFVRAHATTSLGTVLATESTLGRDSLFDEVAAELQKRLGNVSREPVEVRQSAAIALGLLGDADADERDAATRKTLLKAAQDDRDRTVRHFARIALGRVAARPGDGRDREATQEIRRFLLRDLSRASTDTRRWTGIALGLHERFRAAGGAIEPAFGEALRTALRAAKSPSDRGAFSVANGILGEPDAETLLRIVVERSGDDWTRGLGAVGLGLIDARGSLDALREMAPDSTYHPDFLRELAIALGLLGDTEISGILVDQLTKARSLSAQASLARALGRIGDSDSIEPLISLLRSTEEVDLARAFAAVALGEVADEDALPWNTILSVDTNYLAAPSTLFDLQGFGILNIL